MRKRAAEQLQQQAGGDIDTGGAAGASVAASDTESVISSSMSSMMTGTGVSSMSFDNHCSLIRYPNSMSNLRRLRCYLLACQGHHFDYTQHLDGLVPMDVAKALTNNPVVFPDVRSVYLSIDSLALNMLPFDELNRFRTRCFVSFASHQKRNLSLTEVLKLYVAAYQVKTIWKQLWTTIYPVLSPQIIRDVETFVAANPFAVKQFVHILKTSSPFNCNG